MAQFAKNVSTLQRLKQLPKQLWLVVAAGLVSIAIITSLILFNSAAAPTVNEELTQINLPDGRSDKLVLVETRRLEQASSIYAELERIAIEKELAAAEKAALAAQNDAAHAAYIANLFAGKQILSVPFHGQLPLYPTGCEAASVSMLVSYATNKDISVTQIVETMPYSHSNPAEGFVGDPRNWEGWTIYPEAMLNTVAFFAGSASNLTGGNLDTLKLYLDAGMPIVTWVGNSYDLHCVIVVGYDAGSILYHDPYNPAYASMPAGQFESWWAGMRFRALSY